MSDAERDNKGKEAATARSTEGPPVSEADRARSEAVALRWIANDADRQVNERDEEIGRLEAESAGLRLRAEAAAAETTELRAELAKRPPAPLIQVVSPQEAQHGEYHDESEWRRDWGRRTAIAATAGLVLLLFASQCLLPTMDEVTKLTWQNQTSFIAWLIVRGVVDVAGVWFFYELLRVGERLALPLRVKNAEVFLGVKNPVQAVEKELRVVLDKIVVILENQLPGKGGKE